MARALLGSLVVLAGCAEISGLGTLEVCDGACADGASAQDSTADVVANDASSDASLDAMTADAPISSDGTVDGPALGCTKPSDCNGNQPYCCGTISTQGNYPQCQISSVSSKCNGTCTTNIAGQKCTTDTVRICATNQDCTEAFYNRCCAFPYNNDKVNVCSNLIIADAGGATCQ